MTERALRFLRAASLATFGLALVLAAVMPQQPVTENVPGFHGAVVGYELASTPEHVFGILGQPGSPAREEAVYKMDLTNRLDFLFMIAYPAMYVAIAVFLIARDRVRGPLARLLLMAPILMTVGDALENRQLLVLSQLGDASAMAGPLAALGLFTRLKWYTIYGVSGLLVPFIWQERGWWRWSAVAFGLGAACGVVSLVHLPALEWGSMFLFVAWTMTLVRSFQR